MDPKANGQILEDFGGPPSIPGLDEYGPYSSSDPGSHGPSGRPGETRAEKEPSMGSEDSPSAEGAFSSSSSEPLGSTSDTITSAPLSADSQPQFRCTIIGPSDAGKTHLIDSCDQACSDPATYDSSIRLEYIGGEQTRTQTDRSIRTVPGMSFGAAPSDQTEIYESFITATWPASFWRPEKRTSLHLLIKDGPGGALFPSENDQGHPRLVSWEREIIEESQQADAVILCIDSNEPQLDRVSKFLRNILAAMAVPYRLPTAPSPLGHRLLKAIGRSDDSPPITLRRIPAKRFLLLLTKIDRFVNRPLVQATSLGTRHGPTPRDIAYRLSPVHLACELFHRSNLLRVLSALRPGAELAIGLTSAWGFNPSGFPFMEDNNPVLLSNQSRDRQTAGWQPFGVREALLFLLDGRTGGPVEIVTANKIARPMPRALDVPRWYFE